MHLSAVSTTVRRAGNSQETDRVGCPWGRDLTDNCIPESEEIDHSNLMFDQYQALRAENLTGNFCPWEGNMTR